MDIEIAPDNNIHSRSKWMIFALAAVLIALSLTGLKAMFNTAQTAVVQSSQVTVHRALYGNFMEVLNARAVAVPVDSVVVSTDSGGKVVERLANPGDIVHVGQLLARLSNHDFVLEVSSQLAAVTEQINTLRSVKLQLENENLKTKVDLENAHYNVVRLTKERERVKHLQAQNYVKKSTIDELDDELAHWQATQNILREYRALQKDSHPAQLSEITESITRLTQLSVLVKSGLDQLDIRSPISGVVSNLEIDTGQQLSPGTQVAVVDNTDNYHFEVQLNEYYIAMVQAGSKAEGLLGDSLIDMVVSHVSPTVKDGKFKVKLSIKNEVDRSIRRGQSLNIRFTLDQKQDRVFIPSQLLFSRDDKKYVFKYDDNTKTARATEVVTGVSSAGNTVINQGIVADDYILEAPAQILNKVDLIEVE